MTPWMFTFLQNAETTMPAMSDGTKQCVAAMRQQPEIVSGLAAMQAGWQQTCLIHGDIKWDNFLTTEEGDTLKLIDWELADIGDPSWDVAGVLAAYLQTWIFAQSGVPVVAQGPAQLSSGRLEDIWPALNSFWHQYAAGMHWTAEQAREQLVRAAYYSSGRLLLTAIEMHIGAPQMFPVLQGVLQQALQILKNPYGCVKEIFGISDYLPASNGKALLGPDVTSDLAKSAFENASVASQVKQTEAQQQPEFSSDVYDRLKAIFENVSILSPLSFQFGDDEPVTLSPAPSMAMQLIGNSRLSVSPQGVINMPNIF